MRRRASSITRRLDAPPDASGEEEELAATSAVRAGGSVAGPAALGRRRSTSLSVTSSAHAARVAAPPRCKGMCPLCSCELAYEGDELASAVVTCTRCRNTVTFPPVSSSTHGPSDRSTTLGRLKSKAAGVHDAALGELSSLRVKATTVGSKATTVGARGVGEGAKAATRFLKALTASDEPTAALAAAPAQTPEEAALARQARYEAMKSRMANRSAASKANAAAAASPPQLMSRASGRRSAASSSDEQSNSGTPPSVPTLNLPPANEGDVNGQPAVRKWAQKRQALESTGMSMSDVEDKYRQNRERTTLAGLLKSPRGGSSAPPRTDTAARKHQSLTSYTPDNLDYLKAQAQLLQLQSQTGSGAKLNEQLEERRQRRETRKSISDGSTDITSAVKTRPERYQRLMERRQNRSSQYGGAHSHASAEQRKAVLSAQEALLRLRAKQEEEQEGATDDSVLPSSLSTSAGAGDSDSAAAAAAMTPRGRGRSRSMSSGSSLALLQEVAAAKESEQSLIDKLESTSIDALAAQAAATGTLGGIDEEEEDDSDEDAVAGNGGGASSSSRQSNTAVPSMAQFVRAPPKRFQRLLEVRQEQIATAVSDGGQEDTRQRGKAAADVSVEQFATLRSLEAYYKGLGGKDGSHSSGRGSSRTTTGAATLAGVTSVEVASRRGPAFAGLSTLSAHVDEVDEDGDTPLHQAAYDGQLKVVTYLVSKGADVNARNVFDETPLFVAVMNNQLEVVQYLCQQGADLSICNLEGETALDAAEGDVALWLEHYAARRRNAMLRSDDGDARAAAAAANASTTGDAASAAGGTSSPAPAGAGEASVTSPGEPGSLAVPTGTTGSATAGSPSTSPTSSPVVPVPAAVKAKRGKVRKTQQQKDEELLDAVQSGLNREVAKLLEEGANPNFRDEEDETISLHHAAFNGDPKVVEALVEAGAELEAKDVDECTPLHWAAEAGEVAVAKLLLLAGADVNARTGTRGTALHTALHANYNKLVTVLLDSDADVDIADEDGEQPIHAATIAGSVWGARALVDAGASVNAAGAKGATPLHLACSRDELTVVQFLLEHGADVSAVDEEGETPLHWLCTAALVEEMTLRLMAILVDAGASVDATDKSGESPLHVACREGQVGLVRYLLREAGATVDVANRDGWTPLHHAASEGHLSIVRLLVEAGAAIDSREGSGETPFHFACYEDHLEVAKFLYSRGAAAWRMVQWAETAITSPAATWINRIAPTVRDARRREIEAAEKRRADELAAKAVDQERLRAATAAAKAAFEENFEEEGGADLAVKPGDGVSVSEATTKLASRLNWKAAKLELDEMSRADRNRLIGMCSLGAVVVAGVWHYSTTLAIILAILIGGAIFAKRFVDSI